MAAPVQETATSAHAGVRLAQAFVATCTLLAGLLAATVAVTVVQLPGDDSLATKTRLAYTITAARAGVTFATEQYRLDDAERLVALDPTGARRHGRVGHRMLIDRGTDEQRHTSISTLVEHRPEELERLIRGGRRSALVTSEITAALLRAGYVPHVHWTQLPRIGPPGLAIVLLDAAEDGDISTVTAVARGATSEVWELVGAAVSSQPADVSARVALTAYGARTGGPLARVLTDALRQMNTAELTEMIVQADPLLRGDRDTPNRNVASPITRAALTADDDTAAVLLTWAQTVNPDDTDLLDAANLVRAAVAGDVATLLAVDNPTVWRRARLLAYDASTEAQVLLAAAAFGRRDGAAHTEQLVDALTNADAETVGRLRQTTEVLLVGGRWDTPAPAFAQRVADAAAAHPDPDVADALARWATSIDPAVPAAWQVFATASGSELSHVPAVISIVLGASRRGDRRAHLCEIAAGGQVDWAWGWTGQMWVSFERRVFSSTLTDVATGHLIGGTEDARRALERAARTVDQWAHEYGHDPAGWC